MFQLQGWISEYEFGYIEVIRIHRERVFDGLLGCDYNGKC